MVEFLWCELKPHSYFLLINFISMSLISSVMQVTGYEIFYNKSLTLGIKNLLGLFVLFALITLVMAFAAFLVYIFKDTYSNNYQKAYISTQIVFLITALFIAFVLFIISLANDSKTEYFAIYIQRWTFTILFLVLTLRWSLRLKEIMHQTIGGGDAEERRPLNAGNEQNA